MRLALTCHPATPCEAVTAIEVELSRRGPVLSLRYRASGRIADLLLPARAAPARADDLWKHTCFEAFVRPQGGAAYREFNLSPSGQWAAYAFSGYRADMADAPAAPVLDTAASDRAFELAATVEVEGLSGPAHLGLTAVIEETNWRKSYWALVHPGERPDFHHAGGFAYLLAEEVP
jgi:hypothetical protein